MYITKVQTQSCALSALHVTSDGNAWAPLLLLSLDVFLVVADDEALQTTKLCILHASHHVILRMHQ